MYQWLTHIRKQYHFRILNYLLINFLWKLRFPLGMIKGGGGHSHARLTPKESIKHLEQIFKWYREYGNIESFKGDCVEIGPGDNAGVALLMRSNGAKSVTLIDRFYTPRDHHHQEKIYEALSAQYKIDFLKNGSVWNEEDLKGIHWKTGLSAEKYFKDAVSQKVNFDAIVSCAVMEHLYDPLGCLSDMITCLKKGGTIIHCIDFRDHGMFEPRYHPLKYLSIPKHLYKIMTRQSGDPNRILHFDYRQFLENLNDSISFKIFVWMLVGGIELNPFVEIEFVPEELWSESITLVEKWKKEFSKEFKNKSNKDLAVAGICLVIKKPYEKSN